MLKKSELQEFIDYQLNLFKEGLLNKYLKVLCINDKIFSISEV